MKIVINNRKLKGGGVLEARGVMTHQNIGGSSLGISISSGYPEGALYYRVDVGRRPLTPHVERVPGKRSRKPKKEDLEGEEDEG